MVPSGYPDMSLTKESILTVLDTIPGAVERALVVIWNRQTSGEQASRSTQQQNGEGFTAADAYTLSLRAERVARGLSLSPIELDDSRERVKKYWSQLLEVAVERQLQKLAA